MKVVIARSLKHFGRRAIELEVEEELRFHLELCTQEHIQQGMSLELAKDAALKRFGDAEQIKNQCAEISRRSHPFVRAMKSFLILLFLTGVLVRGLSMDVYVGHVGEMFIAVAVFGRLLLYARGLSPASFLSKNQTSSPLILNALSQMPIAADDKKSGFAR